MHRNGLKILLGLTVALILSSCGAAAEKGGERASATPSANTPAPAPTAAGTPDAATTNASAAATPATTTASAPQDGARPNNSRSTGSAQPAPTPVIGSGGNDLFLFTQARAAINADPELRALNLVLDVKDGVVTLSGAVASAAQKSKAEQLVRTVGPKSVKNQLRVSNGN